MRKPRLSVFAKVVLGEFCRHGDYLIPNDDAVRAACKKLTGVGFMHVQPYFDKATGKLGVSYKVSTEGRKYWRKLDGGLAIAKEGK